ncbi:cystathionine beta-lyase [Scopulibacillus darangshiensis]|uniref:cysteine-S-conjugate beta-lyase n=1 Tax=Scopulibacillus darangshiensis TaxID=442528 RepID=A0A4R2P8J1_9BACL|nr:MalY/PatB family protein [Scopulibacillus darangshiensis]TCP31279.1 cystathionine beta-lyase [Scopulibacillus darangshiensis]
MKYDFNIETERFNTASVKWDETENLFGDKDILPMWVADMDFRIPDEVVEALKNRAEHGIFGYTTRSESYLNAVVDWMKERHQWDVKKEWLCHSPGVVTGLSLIVDAFTKPGDKVVIQPPVYYPFTKVVLKHGRDLVFNPLKFEDNRYTMDFDDLERKLDPDVKLLILCSPHNPVGRVWTKEELTRLGEICLKHGGIVVSDEIHFDLVFKEHQHVPFATISEAFANNAIVCTAPSKTFNLASLQTSNIIIPNDGLRETYTAQLEKYSLGMPNAMGMVAAEAAYRYGEEWLDQCIDYVKENLDFMTDYISKNIPKIKVIQPEGTYLAWLDCRLLDLEEKKQEELMLKKAKVAFDEGYIFGQGGTGFTRINLACPRSILVEGLKRLEQAVKNH